MWSRNLHVDVVRRHLKIVLAEQSLTIPDASSTPEQVYRKKQAKEMDIGLSDHLLLPQEIDTLTSSEGLNSIKSALIINCGPTDFTGLISEKGGVTLLLYAYPGKIMKFEGLAVPTSFRSGKIMYNPSSIFTKRCPFLDRYMLGPTEAFPLTYTLMFPCFFHQ
jgi:hypothetical protein